jgi:hypothetical protein|nr:MAG TPA: DNA-directed RNA polymerase [Caudoviricetes sp.]
MTNRQEVAEKLRETARTFDKEYPNGAKDWLDENAAFNTVDEIIGTDNNIPYAPFFTRLADLIEPTCEGVEEREDDGIDAPPRYTSHCGNCGQMWDETSGIPRFPMYCPNCGARVVRVRLNPWVVKD